MLDLSKFGPTVEVVYLQRTKQSSKAHQQESSQPDVQLSDRATAPPADDSVNER